MKKMCDPTTSSFPASKNFSRDVTTESEECSMANQDTGINISAVVSTSCVLLDDTFLQLSHLQQQHSLREETSPYHVGPRQQLPQALCRHYATATATTVTFCAEPDCPVFTSPSTSSILHPSSPPMILPTSSMSSASLTSSSNAPSSSSSMIASPMMSPSSLDYMEGASVGNEKCQTFPLGLLVGVASALDYMHDPNGSESHGFHDVSGEANADDASGAHYPHITFQASDSGTRNNFPVDESNSGSEFRDLTSKSSSSGFLTGSNFAATANYAFSDCDMVSPPLHKSDVQQVNYSEFSTYASAECRFHGYRHSDELQRTTQATSGFPHRNASKYHLFPCTDNFISCDTTSKASGISSKLRGEPHEVHPQVDPHHPCELFMCRTDVDAGEQFKPSVTKLNTRTHRDPNTNNMYSDHYQTFKSGKTYSQLSPAGSFTEVGGTRCWDAGIGNNDQIVTSSNNKNSVVQGQQSPQRPSCFYSSPHQRPNTLAHQNHLAEFQAGHTSSGTQHSCQSDRVDSYSEQLGGTSCQMTGSHYSQPAQAVSHRDPNFLHHDHTSPKPRPHCTIGLSEVTVRDDVSSPPAVTPSSSASVVEPVPLIDVDHLLASGVTVAGFKPRPIIRKRRKITIPKDQQDTGYWQKRKKNNDSAKRSREAKKEKEKNFYRRALELECENYFLKERLGQAEAQLHALTGVPPVPYNYTPPTTTQAVV